jgi:hypothetical protein
MRATCPTTLSFLTRFDYDALDIAARARLVPGTPRLSYAIIIFLVFSFCKAFYTVSKKLYLLCHLLTDLVMSASFLQHIRFGELTHSWKSNN